MTLVLADYWLQCGLNMKFGVRHGEAVAVQRTEVLRIVLTHCVMVVVWRLGNLDPTPLTIIK